MSVVLRCPTCGTTQDHVGECEACTEAEVRYFCTNHDEATWLDSPVCNRCGATFGVRPANPRTPTVPTRAAGPPDFRAPRARRAPGPPAETPSLEELLDEMVEERARPFEAPEVRWPAPPPVLRPGLPVAGCLFRIVGLVGLLILAVVVLLFLLFGGLVIY